MTTNELTLCSPDELRKFARGRLGLLIGPSVTTSSPEFFVGLNQAVAAEFGTEEQITYHETAELAISQGADRNKIVESIVAYVSGLKPSPHLNPLGKIRWSGVLSGAIDHYFENRLQAEFERRPTRRDVSVVSNPADLPGSRTLPVYKLLGSAQRLDFAVTTADFLRRNATWALATRAFLDEIKASPVLCLGFADAPWLLEPLLAHLFSLGQRHPAKLIFLSDDPLITSPRLAQLVPERALVVGRGSLRDVVQSVEPSDRNLQVALNVSEEAEIRPAHDFSSFSDLVTVVNARMEPRVSEEERNRLLDFLFMPDSLAWDPFVYGLDFRRSLERELEGVIDAGCGQEEGSVAIILHGRAASGKTTLLKRLAFNAASKGFLVGWVRSYWYPDGDERLDSFFQQVAEVSKGEPAVLFLDDARRLGALTIDGIASAAERRRVRIVLVVGVRTSDYDQLDLRSLSLMESTVRELQDNLDDAEWDALPSYLFLLGLASDESQGKRQLAEAAASRNTRDTLAVLYWLLPDTRQVITRAVQDEYVRLGDSSSLRGIVIGTVRRSPQMLQDAYSMVAVSCRYGTPVPVEVLVNALGVNYGDWLAAVSEEGPAWGLLYPDDAEDLEGAAYRTRNDLVTDVLVKTINGGTMSHDGEVAIMKRLLATCDSTQPVYHEYVVKVLTPHQNVRHLSLTEGLELYDAAMRALPFADRLITHHKGLFIRAHGGSLDEAIATYRKALEAETIPLGGRVEPDEFVHTSIATALLDKIARHEVSLDDAKVEALAELERSRSPTFLNANGVHVYSRLVFRLAGQHRAGEEVDRAALLNLALAELDHYIVRARSGMLPRYSGPETIQMLEEQRWRILRACASREELAKQARVMWETYQSQDGFVLATRSALADALEKPDAGSDFLRVFDYWSQSVELVQQDSAISPELAEVGLLLYYEWQIRPRSRRAKRAGSSPIRWEMMRDCAEAVLASPRLAEYPFYRYLYGLALAHLGEWAAARRVFEENRRKPMPGEDLHVARDYLLNPSGLPWRLQGHVRRGAERSFFQVDDLRQEFLIDRNDRWPRGEAVQHGFVLFAFAGPRAARSDNRLRSSSG